ncbi:MAG: hypothetical protein ABI823_16780, partial [Bryobacteraceae bacterium]
GLLVLVGCLESSLRLEFAVGSMAITSLILLGAHYRDFPADLGTFHEALNLVRRTLPVGVALICTSLAISVPIWIYQSVAGDSAVGQFYPAVHLQAAAVIVVSGVCQAQSSRVSAAFADRDFVAFRSMLRPMLQFAGILGSLGILAAATFGAGLIRTVFSAAFSIAWENLVLFAIAVLFFLLSSVLGFAATASRRFHLMWRPYLAVPAVASSTAAVLIPWLGAPGLPLALTAGAVAACCAPLFVLRRTGAFR